MKNLIKTKAKKGFSLVELLVVIAVIGVIAAIAIPAMSGIFGKSDETKAKRNAQNIASTYAAALAAGNPGVKADGTTAIANIADATTAVTVAPGMKGYGTFAGSYFVSTMSGPEVTKASQFLSFDPTSKTVSYNSAATYVP